MYVKVLLYLLCILKYSKANYKILTTVYDEPYASEDKGDVGLDIEIRYDRKCHNVPNEWEDRTTSINTRGKCVELYAERNCTGDKWIRLYPGNYGHGDLTTWDFNDRMRSIQACEKHIDEKNYLREGDSVTLYDEPNAQGAKLNLNVESCKNMPGNWVNRASSLITFTHCYVFFSEANCNTNGRSLMVPSNHSYVNTLYDFDKIIRSVDICHENETFLGEVYFIKQTTSQNLTENINNLDTLENITTTTPATNLNEEYTPETIIALSIGAALFFLFILTITGLVVFFVYFRRKTRTPASYTSMDEVRRDFLGQKYIQAFLKGNPLAFEQISYESADTIYRATNLPYDVETFEIPLECLIIDKTGPLGCGEFGIVSKATLSSSKYPEPFQVAVKTLKAGADPSYIKAILAELKIMMYLQKQNSPNKHPHIVNLIGACTEKIYQLQPYIVLEFCEQGSLDVYLKKQRPIFVNLVKDGHLIQPDIKSSKYSNINTIDTLKLIQWSREVVEGMHFLSSNKVIHGDLATRNILLDDNLKAKISDFGLSKQLYHYTQYVKKNKAPLPWRWLAIEILQDMTFSVESDVWAYGITLWEIFSLAEMPYPGIMYDGQFLTQLKEGIRMEAPTYATSDIYQLMTNCWQKNPDERPSFAEIRNYLSTILEKDSSLIYRKMSCN